MEISSVWFLFSCYLPPYTITFITKCQRSAVLNRMRVGVVICQSYLERLFLGFMAHPG